ncbi:isoleucine--tRNA ligase [candidate division CPR3 bacterium 4484_211]|uniref:Isoleucine--tRNA ligase n=1 Tax=candidate division CPR3 bacterium 4484_211 TaxID=1968527 RepID=A0A1W9NYR0_UNCC3|nr:MAG: isoleucine--tRNA ligase [candidate division CPR3 bacterium 4484_211]
MFQTVVSKPNFPQLEEEILGFWKRNKIFEKSVERRPKANSYSFYDGPPFVTGTPHYGSLLPSIAKDVIPRFFTMKGKRVERVWGWDCHGLPIENLVEKRLKLSSRREIDKYGIDKFINECRKYVEETSSEWKWYVDHIGRWVDFDNAYRTMDLSYMESVIWVFKQLYDRGLVYKGVRTSLYCTRCGTPISDFEIAMDNSYTDMEDPAITVKFQISFSKVKTYNLPPNTYFLAWTTTPWTLPSNRALVVDENENYVLVQISGDGNYYILAEKRLKDVLAEQQYRVVGKFKGAELVGLKYQPLFEFFAPNKNDFKVYSYEGMVNMDEGTGIVHSAPGFGQIDTQMGQRYGLSIMFSVDDEGKFVRQVKDWAGVYVKDADPLIIGNLRERDLLFKEDKIVHRYPYCYRCETPLIQRAQESWFINVQTIKSLMLKTNEKINWVPSHFKHGQFTEIIKNAPDWCISRTRYWATVMPVWQCEKCQAIKVVGSIKEIEELGGQKVTDLHRSGVDKITFTCQKCKGVMKRIPEVLDCWVESGSMPYGQLHYPFENKERFKKSFPADFVVEYVAQVRAWFNVMHRISTALFRSPSFKNVIVTGVIKGTDGRKMSKSYGNYPDPRKTIEKYGGDALRLYLMGSPVMLGKDPSITRGEEIEEKIKKVLLILWNSYRYFVTYARMHGLSADRLVGYSVDHLINYSILDRWIISRLNQFILNFEKSLESYNIPAAVNSIQPMVNDLSTWYIRRSRERFVAGDEGAFRILYYVLKQLCLSVAPAVPFIAEEIYQNLRLDSDPESVHLCDWPKVEENEVDRNLLDQMEVVRQIAEKGHAARRRAGIKIKQPLARITVKIGGFSESGLLPMIPIIKDELNVKEVECKPGGKEVEVELDANLTDDLIVEGLAREVRRKVQELRKKAGYARQEKVVIYWQSNSHLVRKIWSEYGKEIGRKVLAGQIVEGEVDKVDEGETFLLQGNQLWIGVKRYKD